MSLRNSKEVLSNRFAAGTIAAAFARCRNGFDSRVWARFVRAGLAVSLSSATLSATPAIAQSRPPYERVMRQMQAKRAYVTNEYVKWPDGPGGCLAPLFPPDGFYGEDLTTDHKRKLVLALYELGEPPEYVRGDVVADSSCTDTVYVWPNPAPDAFTASFSDDGTAKLFAIKQRLDALKYFQVIGGVVNLDIYNASGYKSVSIHDSDPELTLQQACDQASNLNIEYFYEHQEFAGQHPGYTERFQTGNWDDLEIWASYIYQKRVGTFQFDLRNHPDISGPVYAVTHTTSA